MSKRPTSLRPVVEWSAKETRVYDPEIGGIVAGIDGRLNGKSVVLALSRRLVFLKPMRVPDAARHEVRKVLQVQLADRFPAPLHTLAFDFLLTEDRTSEGRLAIVVAVPEVELNKAIAEVEATGAKVVQVVPSSFGSLYSAGGTQPVAVVSNAVDGVAIDIVRSDSLLASRVVPAGRLESEIGRTFQSASLPCGTVWASPNLNLVDADRPLSVEPIALLAERAGTLEFDLEPPQRVAEIAKAQSAQRSRLAALMAVAALGLAAYAWSDYDEARAKVARQQSRANSAVSRLQATQRAAESDAAKAATLREGVRRVFSPAQKASEILTLPANRVPAGIWLTGCTFERGRPISIRGTARSSNDVATYLDRLNAEARLRDVKLVFANNAKIDETEVVQFSISAFPVGNLPLEEPKSSRRRGAR
jgi:Tfp pilus assembly protein PilN